MKKINLVRDINHQQSVLSHQKIKTRRILSSSKSFFNRKEKREGLIQCSSMYGLSSKKIFLSLKQRKPVIMSEQDQQKRKFMESCSISQEKSSLLLKLNEFKIDINIEELKNEKPKTQKAVRKKYQTGRMIKSCLSCQNNLKISSSTPKNNNPTTLNSQNLFKSQACSIGQLRNRQNGPVIFCPFFWQNQRQIKNRVDRIRHIRKIQFKDNFVTV